MHDPIWWNKSLYGEVNGKLRRTPAIQRFETIGGIHYAVTEKGRYCLKFSGPVLEEAFDFDNRGDEHAK